MPINQMKPQQTTAAGICRIKLTTYLADVKLQTPHVPLDAFYLLQK